MTRYTPKDILVEFLRTRVTDPRGRHTATSDSFTASASQTDFVLTPTSGKRVQNITSLTVNGASKSKWQDYYIDLQNQTVILRTASTASDAVVVNYDEGSTSWIYPDSARKDLSPTSFPRISVMVVTSEGERLGKYDADVEHETHFQIDIWTKESIGSSSDQVFTINGIKYESDRLAQILGHMVCDMLQQNENDMYSLMYDYKPVTGPRDMPYDKINQIYHSIVEVKLKMLNPGKNL